MKRLSIPLLLLAPVLFGCNGLNNSELIWPGENDIILFEIKETTKEDFIEKVDRTDCLSEDEKQMIKQYCIFDYPSLRMVKWKYGKKIIISFDQYITRQGRNSETGQLGESRSGYMFVDIKVDGKRVGGHDFNYD